MSEQGKAVEAAEQTYSYWNCPNDPGHELEFYPRWTKNLRCKVCHISPQWSNPAAVPDASPVMEKQAEEVRGAAEVDTPATYVRRYESPFIAVRWNGRNLEEVRKVFPGIGEEYMRDKGCVIGDYVQRFSKGRVRFWNAEIFEETFIQSTAAPDIPAVVATMTYKEWTETEEYRELGQSLEGEDDCDACVDVIGHAAFEAGKRAAIPAVLEGGLPPLTLTDEDLERAKHFLESELGLAASYYCRERQLISARAEIIQLKEQLTELENYKKAATYMPTQFDNDNAHKSLY